MHFETAVEEGTETAAMEGHRYGPLLPTHHDDDDDFVYRPTVLRYSYNKNPIRLNPAGF